MGQCSCQQNALGSAQGQFVAIPMAQLAGMIQANERHLMSVSAYAKTALAGATLFSLVGNLQPPSGINSNILITDGVEPLIASTAVSGNEGDIVLHGKIGPF